MRLELCSRTLTVEAGPGPDGAGRRRIDGVAVPWNVPAEASSGPVMFLEGSLPVDGPAPKLLRDHDRTQPIGLVTERVSTADGMLFSATISRTSAGDEALVLAADGVLDSVSVGVEVDDFSYNSDGVLVVRSGRWSELSLLPFGAFESARVHRVAASEPDPEPAEPEPSEEESMSETHEIVEAATVPTSPLVIAAPAARHTVTAAEYLSAVATGRITPAVQAALAEQGLADTPGILPEPLVGQVYSALNDRRPFIASIGTLAAPAAASWYRRKVTQHTAVGVQAAEFDELTSQKMTVAKILVESATIGGSLLLSEQDIDFSDPAALNLTLTDLARVYAKKTEELACAALVAGVTETDEIADWTDGDEILDALYDASATISGEIDELPTHVFLDPTRWATLGKAKDAAGERIFPAVGPSNAAGTMAPSTFTVAGLGLRFVVSNKFAAGTFIVGMPTGTFEIYERNKGAIRVDKPSTMAVELTHRGYFATAMIDAGAFVAFVDPA